MTKKIAVINDLSGFGRCSLVAAISVLSAMGVQACPMPTAILTAQTGYPSYYCDDYTDKMERYRQEWLAMQVHFDGIYTGFVANEAQIGHIFTFLDSFYEENTFLLVDPVMGDNGVTYDMFTDSLLRQMQTLARRADIITPNLTEFCLITGTDYPSFLSLKSPKQMVKAIAETGVQFCKEGPETIVVTGIQYTDEATRSPQIGNLCITQTQSRLFSFPYIGGSYSGTGDLFASALAAGVARGDSIPEIIQKTGEFLKVSLIDTVNEKVPRNDGINYEQNLSMLTPDLH